MNTNFLLELLEQAIFISEYIEFISDASLIKYSKEIDEAEYLLALKDTPCFAKRYLSHYMVNNKTGELIEFAPFHYEIFEFCDAPINKKRGAIGAPRGHGKSTGHLFFSSRVICSKEKNYPVIVSVNFDKAKSYLADVKIELEYNEKIQKDFGNLVGTETWAKEAIITSHDVKVAVHTIKSKIRGEKRKMYRPDLILVDDCEDDKAVETKEQRDYLYKEWFNKALLKALDNKIGDLIMLGTIIHHDSLLAKLLNPERRKSWYKKTHKALNIDENGNQYALWPEMITVEELLEEKKDDPVAFESEYQNNPIDEETQPFRKEWIQIYVPADIKDKELYVFAGVDPALSEKKTADNSAIIIIGVEWPKWNVYVLHADIKRRTPNLLYEAILMCAPYYKWMACGIEINSFQRLIKAELDRLSEEKGVPSYTVGIRSHSNKEARIKADSPLFQQGKVYVRDYMHQLIDQWITFPKGRYDDGPDGFQMAVATAREYLDKQASWDEKAEANVTALLQGKGTADALELIEV